MFQISEDVGAEKEVVVLGMRIVTGIGGAGISYSMAETRRTTRDN